jgi:FkbM family methyltransferase
MEDVLLARAFGDSVNGFYIDVGAGSPLVESVTRHFYESGWQGINVEPLSVEYEQLCEERHRDVNLRVVLGEESGLAKLYEHVNEPGFSTLSLELARQHMAQGMEVREREVEVVTFTQVCEQYVKRPIDFCKIDVEGYERQVLQGGDWRKWRPRVFCIEATVPGSQVPSHQEWEHLLLGAGYLLAYFDGLNRYYVAEEAEELVPKLAVQPGWYDGIVTHAEVQLRCHIDSLGEHIDDLTQQIGLHKKHEEEVRGYVAKLEAEIEGLRSFIRDNGFT